MTYALGLSPCPNDCFIFDALIHKKIDTHGINFTPHIYDVEKLNLLAIQSFQLDITKLSFYAILLLSNKYKLLNSGAALGFNCGPLLVSKKVITINELPNLNIAIPGQYTTANLLLSILFPQIKNKTVMIYSNIEQAVLNNTVDAGLIIHESRFNYEQKGLYKIIDLGEAWIYQTQQPIPLGGIVMKQTFEKDEIELINQLIFKSIEFAFKYPSSSINFIKKHCQEMDDQIINQHIKLYVNKYSLQLGSIGQQAIQTLSTKMQNAQLINRL